MTFSPLQALTISGSDQLDCFRELFEGHEVELKGSFPALQALKSGKADIAIAAYKDPNFECHPFLYQAPVVVVHQDNPLESITKEELKNIFGSKREFHWRSLLKDPSYKESSILPYISKEFMTFELFQARCLNHENFNDHVHISPEDSLVVSKILKQPDGLGIVAYPNSQLKTLKLEGYFPEESSYPLKTEFYILYQKERKSDVLDLIERLNSEKSKKIAKNNNFFIEKLDF